LRGNPSDQRETTGTSKYHGARVNSDKHSLPLVAQKSEEQEMSKSKEAEVAVLLEVYQGALARQDDEIAAMEKALLALDAYRAAIKHGFEEAPIHADTLAAYRLRTRAAVVRCMADALIDQEHELTIDLMASRLGTTRRKIKRMMSLKGQGRRGIDQVSDLLVALGFELDFGVEKDGRSRPGDTRELGD
jgi:hypothetical protein